MGSGTSHKDGVTQPPGVVADATGLLPPMGLTAAKGVPGSKLDAQLSGELLSALLRKHKDDPVQAIADFLGTEIYFRSRLSPTREENHKWQDAGNILGYTTKKKMQSGKITTDDDVKGMLTSLSDVGDVHGNLQHRRELAGLYFTLRRMVFPDAPFPDGDVKAAGLLVQESGVGSVDAKVAEIPKGLTGSIFESFRPGLSIEVLERIKNKHGSDRLEALKEFMRLEVQLRIASSGTHEAASNWGDAKNIYFAFNEEHILSGQDIASVQSESYTPEREKIGQVYLAARKIVYPDAPIPT